MTLYKYSKIICFYGFLFLVLTILCTACMKENPLPSLKETFAKKEKDPFGTYVFYDQAALLFNRNKLNVKKENFEIVWQHISDTASLYIIVSKNLFLTEEGKKAMLDYVDSGNTLLISSDNIDTDFLDTLNCKVNYNHKLNETFLAMRSTSVKMDSAIYDSDAVYSYFYFPLKKYFAKIDTATTNILGRNELGEPNLIEVFYGKGKLYLQCEPRALSNYFLLQKTNYKYLQNLFAFINVTPEHVYWDDYYNKKNHRPNDSNKSGIQILLQYPAMAWALWLLVLLLVLYILFGSKRRQRVVKTIAPITNTTVAFTETVGHLYLQKKDNHNIADKMILYFFEYIRRKYYLNTNLLNDDFITTLSRKANVSLEATEALFQSIKLINNSFEISDEQLLILNQQIENFYKNKI